MLAFQVDQTEILCYAKKPCSSNSSILFRFSSIRSFFLRIVSLKAAFAGSTAAKIGVNSESSKFWSDYFHLEVVATRGMKKY